MAKIWPFNILSSARQAAGLNIDKNVPDRFISVDHKLKRSIDLPQSIHVLIMTRDSNGRQRAVKMIQNEQNIYGLHAPDKI